MTLLSAVCAVQILGDTSIGRGDVAAARYAQERAGEVARWLDPPDVAKYSGKQLVAALLATRAQQGTAAIALALPEGTTGALVAVPVAWSGSTTSTSGARVTVRIDANVVIRLSGWLNRGKETGGHAARCFSYTLRAGEDPVVRKLRCPLNDTAMKVPKPAPLPSA
ncbi:MAG: hypothetical protein AAGC49_09790 [Brevundimonas sp.]